MEFKHYKPNIQSPVSIDENLMVSKKLIDLINFRINQEEYSSRIYHAMHIWLEHKSFFNGSKLYKKYSQEELTHAEWAIDFMLSLDIKPGVQAIQMPTVDFTNYEDILIKTLEHEKLITKQCQELMMAAHSEGNMLVYTLGHKYVQEQIEELDKANDLLQLFKNFKNDTLAEQLFDHEIEEYN